MKRRNFLTLGAAAAVAPVAAVTGDGPDTSHLLKGIVDSAPIDHAPKFGLHLIRVMPTYADGEHTGWYYRWCDVEDMIDYELWTEKSPRDFGADDTLMRHFGLLDG